MRAVFIALFFSLLCGRAGGHFTEPRLLGEDARAFTQATTLGEAGDFKDERLGLTEETHTDGLWAGWLPVMEERSRTVSGITGVTTRRWFQWGADLSGTLDGAGGIGGLVGIIEEDGAGVVTRTLLPVQDGLGNITAVIDQATGRTVARYDYGPFGEPLAESGEVDACPFRWQTKWYDAESQHYYFGYRHYDPRFGRWLSRDPLGEAGGFNLYAYCGNDPVNRHDPLGLSHFLWGSDGNGRLVEDELSIICHGVSARGIAGPPVMMRMNGETWHSNPYDFPAGVAGGVVAAPQRLLTFFEEAINVLGGKYSDHENFWEVNFGFYNADYSQSKTAQAISKNVNFDSPSYKTGAFAGDLAANAVITFGAGEALAFAKTSLLLPSEEIVGQSMMRAWRGWEAGGVFPKTSRPASVAARGIPDPYTGIRQASQYLRDMGVSRADRVRYLQSFEP
jgi:RHS repeat-associated protein